MAQFYRPKSTPSANTRRNLQLQIEQLELHGKGVGFLKQKPVFVAGALPGERVNISLTQTTKKTTAKLIEVLEPSAERVEPACPIYHRCGGCQLQHLQSSAQIQHKQQALADYLQRKGLAVAEWAAPLRSEPFAYRRRARLAIDARKQPAIIGFRQEKSAKVTDISHCAVLSQPLNQLLQQLRQLLCRERYSSAIGHIDLLETDSGAVAGVRLMRAIPTDVSQRWQQSVQQAGGQLILLGAGQSPDVELSYLLDGLKIGFAADNFIQVNADVNQQMVAQALDWLEPNPQDQILDLFCGVGNFSLPLAKRCQQVVGVEGVNAMVAQAQQNGLDNGLNNLRFLTADLSQRGWHHALKGSFNKLLLDPARAGAEQVALEIDRLNVDSLVYVSCHPASLVRDAQHICNVGYRIAKAGVMDMFPQTQHVESMLLFRRD